MPAEHITDGQKVRAARLRERIEQLKSGAAPDQPLSLRDQIERRAREVQEAEEKRRKDAEAEASSQKE